VPFRLADNDLKNAAATVSIRAEGTPLPAYRHAPRSFWRATMQTTHWKSAILALMIGLTPLAFAPAPAEAGGSVTVTVTPKGKGAKAVKKGLTVLSKVQERRNQVRVQQNGSGNGAYVSQNGSGNWLGVFQRGSGHSATASQDGNSNTLGIFQFGKNTSTSTTQTGNGKVGLIFQGGW
jgi:hypothetical protein